MPTFKMERSYEGTTKLDTKDMLSAIRRTCNYEGDLYVDGRLVMSCLGLSREDNTRSLLKHGITSYVNTTTRCWEYRYTDPAKQNKRYYVDKNPYEWDGKETIDFRIFDYRTQKEDVEYESLEKTFEGIRNHIREFTFDTVHVSMHDSFLGYQSVKQEDWMTEGEPVIYQLLKNGVPVEFGFKHGVQEKLERNIKYKWEGEWSVQLYSPAESAADGKQLGDVVMTATAASHGYDTGTLFLIDGIHDGIYTLRELDDYKCTIEATVDDLMIPAEHLDSL